MKIETTTGTDVVFIDTPEEPGGSGLRIRLNGAQIWPAPEVGVLGDEEVVRLYVQQIATP